MKLFKLFLFTAFILNFSAFDAKAQIADQPCDTQFWRQMSAKAWLEAEREIMQNQNLIFKPDSVLEYTCFDQFVSMNAHDGGNIFVHTDYFGQQIVPRGTDQSLETVLTAVVTNSLDRYKTRNFANSFLSGRAEAMGITPPNSSFSPATTAVTSYTCNTMSNVWRASKCMNFVDQQEFEDTDGFYPFDVIVGYNGTPDVDGYAGGIQETRVWPASLACAAGAMGPAGTWENQNNLAQNTSDNLYAFQAPLGTLYNDIYDMTREGVCGEPILTGIQVITGDGVAPYADGVCTNPGCVFNRNGTCGGGATLPPACASPPC